MAKADRRTTTGHGRRETDHAGKPKAVSTLGPLDDIPLGSEYVSVDGHQVSMPMSFGCDGEQRRQGLLSVSAEGSVTALRH